MRQASERTVRGVKPLEQKPVVLKPAGTTERTFYEELGKRIRRRRRLLGYTQQQVADALGIRFQQVQKYECGANRIPYFNLFRLAAILSTTVAELTPELQDDALVALSSAEQVHLSPRAQKDLERVRGIINGLIGRAEV